MGQLRNSIQVYLTYLHITFLYLYMCLCLCAQLRKANKQAEFIRQQKAQTNHSKCYDLCVCFPPTSVTPTSSTLQRKQKPARRISSSIPTSPPTSIFILTVIPLIQSRHTICPRLSHLHVPYTFLPSQKPHFNIIFLSLSSMALFYGHRHMFKMLKPF